MEDISIRTPMSGPTSEPSSSSPCQLDSSARTMRPQHLSCSSSNMMPTQRPRATFESLPAEILIPILHSSCTPALIHVSRHLRATLPPYVRYTQALAAIATCPEPPDHNAIDMLGRGRGNNANIMTGVFDRVLEKYYVDCCVAPLTVASKWEIRAAVWSSAWFGARQFEQIVLLLYREFLEEALRLVQKPLCGQLKRLQEHMAYCRDLSMIVGKEVVEGVRFKRDKAVRGRKQRITKSSGRRRRCQDEIMLTFRSISIMLSGREHRLTIWGNRHLLDLPDGLFKTPLDADQIRVIRFLSWLDWHSTSKATLMPRRHPAFGQAVSWAIAERSTTCIELLLQLYNEFRNAGNQQALHVYSHMQEGLMTQDRQIIQCLCRSFQLPFSVDDFFSLDNSCLTAGYLFPKGAGSGNIQSVVNEPETWQWPGASTC